MAAFAVLLLAAYHYGAGDGRPKLPAMPWKHSVAFRLHAARADGREP